ncbi:MAG: FAD-dependent oxidoreductase, partial [Cyanobacteria bacterium P01_A01_bin.80]
QVVMALSPKLWANSILMEPSIPENVLDVALNTQTWMEGSLKVALSYMTPFWRNKGQSGTLFSNTGPITEFYDHSNVEGDKFALCGFVNSIYGELELEERKKVILDQLVSVFGDEAKAMISYQESIWSEEEFTSSTSLRPLFPHENNGHSAFQRAQFNGKLFFASAETSAISPGYMDGAVLSAERVIENLTAHC